MKPIYVPCRRFFRVKKIGVYFLEGMPIEKDAAPGLSEPEKWQPYKLWVGDRFECEGCGAVILSGFGRESIAEHYQDGFTERVKSLQADEFQVNDC